MSLRYPFKINYSGSELTDSPTISCCIHLDMNVEAILPQVAPSPKLSMVVILVGHLLPAWINNFCLRIHMAETFLVRAEVWEGSRSPSLALLFVSLLSELHHCLKALTAYSCSQVFYDLQAFPSTNLSDWQSYLGFYFSRDLNWIKRISL